jgi:hypothetical protein
MWIFLLMGTLMLGTMLGFGSDSGQTEADSDDLPEDDELDESTPRELTLNGDETITGGSGNDTLSPNEEMFNGPSATLVDLGGGDDVAQVNGYVDTILGGDGDDNIEFLQPSLGHAFGGDGDDTLSGNGDVLLDGGSGDDVIITDFVNGGLNDTTATAVGGEGNDHFIVTKDVTAYWENDVGGVRATGGEGEDLFDLTFVYGPDTDFDAARVGPNNPDGRISSSAGIFIEDFDPAEDILRIEIEVPEGEEIPALSRVEIEPSNSGDYPNTNVSIFLEATDTQPATQVSLYLRGAVDISPEDIQFVNVLAVAA